MGRVAPENGFILFARDLRKKMRDSNCSWEEFINGVASERWQRLSPEQQEAWKQESKQTRRDQRVAGTARPQTRSRQEDPPCLDDFDILEKMPRKRTKDVKDLQTTWDWQYSDDRPGQKDHNFCLMAVEHYCQKTMRATDGSHFQPTYFYPAEVSVVQFSLSKGITQEYHRIFGLIPDEELDWESSVVKEEVDYRTRVVHGLPVRTADAESHKKDLQELRKLLTREHGRQIYCFFSDFLPVIGCMEHVTQFTKRGSVFRDPVRALKCVEDLAQAMVKWHWGKVEPEDFQDLKCTILRASPDYHNQLCDVHKMMEERPPECRLVCCLGLLRGAVELIRKWVSQRGMDEELKGTKMPSGPLLPQDAPPPAQQDGSRDVVELSEESEEEEDEDAMSLQSSVAEDEHVKAFIEHSKMERRSPGWERVIMKAEESRKKDLEQEETRRVEREVEKNVREQKKAEERRLAEERRRRKVEERETRKQAEQRQAFQTSQHDNPFLQSGFGRAKKTSVEPPAPGGFATAMPPVAANRPTRMAAAAPPPDIVTSASAAAKDGGRQPGALAASLGEFQFSLPVGQRGIGRGLQLLDLGRIFQAYGALNGI